MIKKSDLKTWMMFYSLHKELIVNLIERPLDIKKLIKTYNNSFIEEKEDLRKIILEISDNLRKREQLIVSLSHIKNGLKVLELKDINDQLNKQELKIKGDEFDKRKIDEGFFKAIKLKEVKKVRAENRLIRVFKEKKTHIEVSIEQIDKAIKEHLKKSIKHIIYFSKKSNYDIQTYFEELSEEKIEGVFQLGISTYLIDYLLDEKNMMILGWDELNHKEKKSFLDLRDDYRKIYFGFLLLKNLNINSLEEEDKIKNFILIKKIYDMNLLFSTWYDKKTDTLVKFNPLYYMKLVENHKKIEEIIPSKKEMKLLIQALDSLNKEEKEKLNVSRLLSLKINYPNINEKTYNTYKKRIQKLYDRFKRSLPIDEIFNKRGDIDMIKEKQGDFLSLYGESIKQEGYHMKTFLKEKRKNEAQAKKAIKLPPILSISISSKEILIDKNKPLNLNDKKSKKKTKNINFQLI